VPVLCLRMAAEVKQALHRSNDRLLSVDSLFAMLQSLVEADQAGALGLAMEVAVGPALTTTTQLADRQWLGDLKGHYHCMT